MSTIAIKSVVVAAVLVAALRGGLAADFHEGLAAYKRGDYEAALREWRPLAAQGDAEAQYRLARMYYHGEGVRDDAQAAKWYRLAAEQEHVKAQNNLALMYEEGRGVEQDDAEAVRWYRRAAEQGLVTAQGNLARLYDRGRGVERDLAEAARWYRRAAERDHAKSQYRLGVMYEEGTGVPTDLGRAAKWYRRAAKEGHGPAQAAIGAMYAQGRGVPRDIEKATKWLGRASAQGIAVDAFARVTLVEPVPLRDSVPEDRLVTAEESASSLPVGDRVPEPDRDEPGEVPEPPAPDAEETSIGPESVAEPEDIVPAETTPLLPPEPAAPVAESVRPSSAPSRHEREGQPVGFPELREISRRAEGGDARAQYRLASMYGTGDGAPQSMDSAARWYLAAAEQGHEMAAYKLAILYLRGRGVPRKDYVQAYRWFGVSAELGVGDAGEWRDKIRKKMTQQEITEAERFIDEWSAKEPEE
jgi:TPR repeat protein